MMVSKCHHAAVEVRVTEGGAYYECEACGRATDVYFCLAQGFIEVDNIGLMDGLEDV